MKKITDRFGGFVTSLLAGILGLLGFSACSNDNDPELLCMYGTPIGSFEVKGTVTDEAGDPVSGAYIINRRGSSRTVGYSLPGDTAVTGANGSYTLNSKDFGGGSIKLVCNPNSSKYEADSITVSLKYSGGKGGWDMGHADASQNFTLKKKSGN